MDRRNSPKAPQFHQANRTSATSRTSASPMKEFYTEPDTVKWFEDRGLHATLRCQESGHRRKELDKSKV